MGAPASARTWDRELVPELEAEEDPLPGFEFESATLEEDLAARVRLHVYRKPLSFDHEFALLVVNGRIQRAFVISTARPGRIPILGKYRLEVPRVRGNPWPWRRSNKYRQSPMYWAVQIRGGFFFHSSPHYGNLGAPASNGCVRASYPDAMEVFDAVANDNPRGVNLIELEEGLKLGSGTPAEEGLRRILRQSGWTVSDLERALARSFREIRAVSRGDVVYAPGVSPDAHVRPFTGLTEKTAVFPSCGDFDCWDLYHRPRRILALSPALTMASY